MFLWFLSLFQTESASNHHNEPDQLETWKNLVLSNDEGDENDNESQRQLPFAYSFYSSPEKDGIGYWEARQLCLELGAFPAIILTKLQHYQVCLQLYLFQLWILINLKFSLGYAKSNLVRHL